MKMLREITCGLILSIKGLAQSNKIGMLHKIEGKSLISLSSPSPSPTVLSYCFIQDILPNPPSPFIFHID